MADVPKRWGLGELGLTGRMNGRAELEIVLAKEGVDLSGSSGTATIEGGSLQGIPVKSLHLTMRGDGQELRYDTASGSSGRPPGVPGPHYS